MRKSFKDSPALRFLVQVDDNTTENETKPYSIDASENEPSDIQKKRASGKPGLFPVTIPTTPQIRMTACLVGNTVLDCSAPFVNFDDSIGIVSDWRKKGPCYCIPFSCLYGKSVRNLITAGRCISVTDDMWDITRVIPDCAVTGQAAGQAAAMTSDFSSLDVRELQAALKENGVKLFF